MKKNMNILKFLRNTFKFKIALNTPSTSTSTSTSTSIENDTFENSDSTDITTVLPIELKQKSKRVSTVDNTYRIVRFKIEKQFLSEEDINLIKNNSITLMSNNDIKYDSNIVRESSLPFSSDEYKIEETDSEFVFIVYLTVDNQLSDSTIQSKDGKLGASVDNDFSFSCYLYTN